MDSQKILTIWLKCVWEYQVRVDGIDSAAFNVATELKPDDTLCPLLFNMALEKAVRILQD